MKKVTQLKDKITITSYYKIMEDYIFCMVRDDPNTLPYHVLFNDCLSAFNSIPDLVGLKRDGFNAFYNGVNANISIVSFDEEQDAEAFCDKLYRYSPSSDYWLINSGSESTDSGTIYIFSRCIIENRNRVITERWT